MCRLIAVACQAGVGKEAGREGGKEGVEVESMYKEGD
jgi:hypothetical protein